MYMHTFCKPWNDNLIIEEIKRIILDIGHFPSFNELRNMKKDDLRGAICNRGGINKFKEIMEYEITRHNSNYWTEEKVLSSLKDIIDVVGYLPSCKEIRQLKGGLNQAVSKHGGYNKFRMILEGKYMKRPNGYWDDNRIIIELVSITKEIGYFPIIEELYNMNKTPLCSAINSNGGINKYRRMLGYREAKKSNGHWTEKNILLSLVNLCITLGRFPCYEEIGNIYKGGIFHYIIKRGGINRYRKILSYDEVENNLVGGYVSRRGKKTEEIVYLLISDYCKKKGLQQPLRNVRFKSRKMIEFVCNINGTIGIDVTNTRHVTDIRDKWLKKDYHNNLDFLLIVVFSDNLTEDNYKLLTSEAPSNVFVISIDELCNILQSDLDVKTKDKIEKFKKCTFRERLKEIKGN